MRVFLRIVTCSCLLAFFVATESVLADANVKRVSTPVLDGYSYWRGALSFRPVVYAEKTKDASLPKGYPMIDPPLSGWRQPDFNDGEWFKLSGPALAGGKNGWGSVESGGGSQEISMICLRGRFSVADPSAVVSLNFSAKYRGGIVVYLNGEEVTRAHLGAGELTADSLADEYPWETFVNAKGNKALSSRPRELSDEDRRRVNLRVRSLDSISLPVAKLRTGVNVIAVELHRAPVHPKSIKLNKYWKYNWIPVGLVNVTLTALPEGSVAANLQRPSGIQVWNEDTFADVYDLDYADPNEPLRPISLVGVRNGSFSGQVVIGSDSTLKGVSAVMSSLKTQDGKHEISLDNILMRYPVPSHLRGGTPPVSERKGKSYRGKHCLAKVRFGALLDSPMAEVPVRDSKTNKGYKGIAFVPGAVQPVRVTVEVPKDAAPGIYKGVLMVKADGLKETKVPFSIEVIDWVIPDSGKFASHLGIVQSADSLAFYYNVPLWSDRHWELIDRSFSILGRAGGDALYLPLIMKFHWGREGLVRWIKNEDGSFFYDFSIFEKYLDVAFKHIKDPDVVCLYVWDRIYRSYERKVRLDKSTRKKKMERFLRDGPPHPIVPLLDPKTGIVTEMKAPVYSDKASVAFWKPVLDGCRERIKKHGVKDEAMLIGVVPDGAPAPQTIDNFYEAAPWAKWVVQAHAPSLKFRGVKVPQVNAYFAAGVYGGTRKVPDPADGRLYGWKPYKDTTEIFCVFPRTGSPYRLGTETTMSMYYVFQEAYLMSGHRGIARVGAEFWPVTLNDRKKGKEGVLISAYAINTPSMKLSVFDFLAPGKEGALSTVRLESLYEGSQEGEARVFIEKALESHKGKLSIDGLDPAATEKKLQDLLDIRTRMFRAYYPVLQWYSGSGWRERSAELYRAAGKVALAIDTE